MDFYQTELGRKIAFHRSFSSMQTPLPGVVFLGGYKSDMEGSKATHLEAWCRSQGRSFLRFDYSGHGQSSGAFEEGCIGDWYEDAVEIIKAQTSGPQVLVGSSMGGWISLLIAREHPELLSGLVTIAAAPDFATMKWESLSQEQQAIVLDRGFHQEPSEYGEDYIFTKRLFEDGKSREVLSQPLAIHVPYRMVQGTQDNAVSTDVALRLLDHLKGPDISLELVKDKDHSFSDPECLALIEKKIMDVS